MNLKKMLQNSMMNLIAWFITAIMLIPLLFIVINSFKTSSEAQQMSMAFPDVWQWVNFQIVIERGNLIVTFFNSMFYSVGSVLLTTLLASLAAYVFARNKTKLHHFLYFFVVLGITMPINFITLIRVMQTLQLMNSRVGIILLYSAIQIPFNVFLIYSFIGKIPQDIDEAAIIDGCSAIQLFVKVILPLLRPVLITVMVLTFLNTWNEFVLPLFILGNSNLWPMPLGVYNFFGMFHREWNLISAYILLTSLPVIIVYLAGQKYIVSGMTTGAVKG